MLYIGGGLATLCLSVVMFEHMCCTCERKDVTMYYVCSIYGFSINKININAGLTVKNDLVFINSLSVCV